MSNRVLLGVDGVRVSRPGVDLFNYGNNNNLLLNIGTRSSQIIQQGSFALTASSTQFTCSGGVDIGPFDVVPDIIYQILFDDGIARHPPIIYNGTNAAFNLFNSAQVSISNTRIDATLPNFRAAPYGYVSPAWFLFFIYRKASF